MTAPVRGFPEVQRVLADALAVFVPSINQSGTETPGNLEQMTPFIRVRRNGGLRDQLNEHATVDIDVFALTYVEAEALAEKVSQFLCGPPPPVAQFDRIECLRPPEELPWGGDGRNVGARHYGPHQVRRMGAVYSVTSRRRRIL